MLLATRTNQVEKVQKESNICQPSGQREGGVLNMICDILIKNPEVLRVNLQWAEYCESRPPPSHQDEKRAMTDLPQLYSDSYINAKTIMSWQYSPVPLFKYIL